MCIFDQAGKHLTDQDINAVKFLLNKYDKKARINIEYTMYMTWCIRHRTEHHKSFTTCWYCANPPSWPGKSCLFPVTEVNVYTARAWED
jgi:hypothetical protein